MLNYVQGQLYFVWNRKFHCRHHKSLPAFGRNTFHAFSYYCSKTNFIAAFLRPAQEFDAVRPSFRVLHFLNHLMDIYEI